MQAEDDPEVDVFGRAASAFAKYHSDAIEQLVHNREMRLESLSGEYKEEAVKILGNHLEKIKECIQRNSVVTYLFSLSLENFAPGHDPESFTPTALDEDKVMSILRQLAREWSVDGEHERSTCFGMIEDALLREFPDPSGITVLVPGCGLGRLPFDLSRLGFQALGSEVSAHMLLTSNIILNASSGVNCWHIYPWIHSLSNCRKIEDAARTVTIPDIWPRSSPLQPGGEIGMSCGTFEDSFAQAEAEFDAIATAFFLDTSSNILLTLDVLTKCVKPGGIWINMGPLLWHFEGINSDPQNSEYCGGLEITLDDVIAAAKSRGWVFERHDSGIHTTYCDNSSSMSHRNFDCEFWIARKQQ